MSLAGEEDPRRAKDPNAWRAMVVAIGLGFVAAVLMGLIVEAAVTAQSSCAPGHTCHGIPKKEAYPAWIIGGAGFLVPALATVSLDKAGQRWQRWLCAGAAVAVPLLTIVGVVLVARSHK
jgi:hypothetical protein